MEEMSFVALVVELAESSGTWKALAIGGLVFVWKWWGGVQKHLCRAIPDALEIVRSLAVNGLDIRLKLNLVDEDGDDTPDE